MAGYPLALWIVIHETVEDSVRMFQGDGTKIHPVRKVIVAVTCMTLMAVIKAGKAREADVK